MTDLESTIVQKILDTFDSIKAIYLFGSTVSEETHGKSDVDVALYAGAASIDLGMRIARMRKLGIPQESREVFEILQKESILSEKLSRSLQNMVGFRNLAVHDYQKLNLPLRLLTHQPLHLLQPPLPHLRLFSSPILI